MAGNPEGKIRQYGIESHEVKPVEASRLLLCQPGPNNQFLPALQNTAA
jgi:hypothetical protein